MLHLTLSRSKKRALIILTDIFLVILSLWLAYTLRLGVWFWPSQIQLWILILTPVLALPIFFKFELYQEVIRYIGHRGMLAIVQATGVVAFSWFLITTAFIFFYFDIEMVFPLYLGPEIIFPRSVPVIFWMTLVLTIGGSRQVARWILISPGVTLIPRAKKNVLIYGAGAAGIELASSLSQNTGIKLLGIIDDDKTLKDHIVQNLKVLGDRAEIEKIRSKVSPLEILLAMPSMQRKQRKELFKYLEDKKVAVKTIPSLNDIASGQANLNDLQEVDIIDLLGREEVSPNKKLLTACISSKNVMVTGAGGSIGSELCRQILKLNPSCIVLLEHSEHNLYSINLELTNFCKSTNCNINIISILGSVTKKKLVEDVIKDFDVDTIYHAAAYKHVALLEKNIWEGVFNNIFGTYRVARAALELNVGNFILISTDKAVRPSSVMGATKRIAELIIQGLSEKHLNEHKGKEKATRFVIVRFGNVIGSSGSVIPLFKKQIASGGPITITHPKASRYFMTIPEASQLVIQASSMGNECNVFMLNMGEPVSILNLATQMIYWSGNMLKTHATKKDNSCLEIKYTGLQKGEKIHEELFIGVNITSTEHPMIMKAHEDFCSWSEVEEILAKLESNQNQGDINIRQLLLSYAMGES
jgi:UDP-N-acetylglucosamine 4,6-dehydratase